MLCRGDRGLCLDTRRGEGIILCVHAKFQLGRSWRGQLWLLLIPCVARSHLMVRQKGQQLMTSIINCFISMTSPNIDSTVDHQSSTYTGKNMFLNLHVLLLKCMCTSSYGLWYVYHICFTCGTSLHVAHKLNTFTLVFIWVKGNIYCRMNVTSCNM